MLHKLKLLIISLIFVTTSSFSNWKSERENLERVYTVNEFRLFYSLNGKNAIKNKSDINKNNIPDIVENIALQLDVSNRVFKDILNFKSPLEQNRYTLQNVKNIDIHFLEIEENGTSGDASILYKYKIINNNSKSLSIAISNNIKLGDLTPEHEFFHAYQNGYTLFKNRWYTEGTARWSEFIFKEGTGPQNKLPSNIEDIHELLSKTYDAKYFWNRLLRVCTKESKNFNLLDDLKNEKYIGTNTFVVEGNDIYGVDFMRVFFNNMNFYDILLSKEENLDIYSWRESKQKDFLNNKYILLAIKKTIKEINPKYTQELNDFLNALDLYLKQWEIDNKIPDFTEKIQEIGIPYKNKYLDDTEHVYSRNVWDMKLFENKLYFGAGNASNTKPSANAGPVPIISYDIELNKFNTEGIVDDELIELFRVINSKLFIPGSDGTQSHEFGNFYIKEDNKWTKFRNIPNALHVFDMIFFDNKLIAAISTKDGAAVAISTDFGFSWSVQQLGKYQRVYSLIIVNSKLFALKQLWNEEKIQKMNSKIDQSYYFISEYVKGNFIPRFDLSKRDLFPYEKLKDDLTLRISKSIQYHDKTVYLASYYYDNPFAFFITSNLDKNNVHTKYISHPSIYKPVDLIVKNDDIYFLLSKKNYKEYENLIFKVSNGNIENTESLFKFRTKTLIRSFEFEKDIFYFGLGSSVKSKKNWKQKELHPDTGKIIKINIDKF
jgi:hypothetical protein